MTAETAELTLDEYLSLILSEQALEGMEKSISETPRSPERASKLRGVQGALDVIREMIFERQQKLGIEQR